MVDYAEHSQLALRMLRSYKTTGFLTKAFGSIQCGACHAYGYLRCCDYCGTEYPDYKDPFANMSGSVVFRRYQPLDAAQMVEPFMNPTQSEDSRTSLPTNSASHRTSHSHTDSHADK